jgi:diaminohydroxyphosphoribosylaminopyrimidine deaminase/5-amino-6-(5-phosphoribosylamino)uracil reductase
MAAISNLPEEPSSLDERYMRLALRQARKGLGKTSPNPAVGAVLVRDGAILSSGWHQRAGGPHAEIEALSVLPNPELAAGTVLDKRSNAAVYRRDPPCKNRPRSDRCD